VLFPNQRKRQVADKPARLPFVFADGLDLEVETYFSGQSPRRDVVRAAEGGEEVVQRVFVGDVYGCQTKAPFTLVAIEEIVFAHR
jgi:hypothetical protein